MKERIIVITGASGGLAEEIIKRLSQTDQLVLLGRDKEKLEDMYAYRERVTCFQFRKYADKRQKEEAGA